MEDNAPYTVFTEEIDRKYKIKAYNPNKKIAEIHSEHDSVLFLARDAALPDTLRFYRHECERLGAAKEQLYGIDLLIKRVEIFQEVNAGIVKVADVEIGDESARVLAEKKS